MSTVYFTACRGKVSHGANDVDRREGQAYVNRNNAAAARRGDDTKPYHLLAYTIPPGCNMCGGRLTPAGQCNRCQEVSCGLPGWADRQGAR